MLNYELWGVVGSSWGLALCWPRDDYGMLPIAYSLQSAAEAVGLSIDTIKREVKANNLAVRYYGRKPLIPATALEKWFNALPSVRQRT